MTLTRARTIQYVGILLSLGIIAVGYWYFSVRAGVKTNTGALQSQAVGDLSAGLAGYWKLDETTGSSAADASTNGNTGTLTNMENGDWVTGQIGNGLTFDGVDEYVTAGTNSALDIGTNPFSLSVWFKTTDTSGAIIGKGGTNSGGERYYIGTETADCTSGQVKVDIDDDTTKQFVCSTTTVTDNAWHQVVLVRGRATLEIYVDGKKEGASVDITGYGSLNSTRPFTVGSMYDEVAAAQSSFFAGTVDEARLYHRALSADEIASLYRLTTPTGVDTGLKGYWSFNSDATTSTTAYDWSGAGNNGTLTNGPAITEGRVGQAFNFDGSNDYVDVGDVPSIEGQNQFTVAGWIKPNSFVNYACIFGKKVDNTNDLGLCEGGPGFVDNTGIVFIIRNGAEGVGSTPANTLRLNQWTQVVGVFDGTQTGNVNRMKVYVDGVEVSLSFSGTVPATTPSLNQNFLIGKNGSGSEVINGSIDEPRLYNRALSAAEIKSLYDRGAPDKTNTSALQAGGTGRLDSGLSGYWKLDETTGSSASDASTNGNTGTLTNMENGDWVTGQIGNGLDFDGTNEYVSASATPFTSHSSGTITAWIKSTNGAAAQTIFGISTLASSNYAGYFHTNANGKLQMRIKGNGVDLVSCGVTDSGSSAQVAASGTWTFVAITNDGTGKKMYKNGSLQGTDCGSDTTWLSALSAQPPVDASIGAWLVAGGPQSLFQGSIDEVRVYDHALSQDQIGNLYRLTTPTAIDTGLKGYWSFNGQDASGTAAYDRSGAGNNGTLTNGPTAVEGLAGQALSFDGTDDEVTTTTSQGTAAALKVFTLSAWFKTSSASGKKIIGMENVQTGTGASTSDRQLWMGTDGKIRFGIFTSTTKEVASATTLNDNRWHHAVGVSTGDSGVMSLYIDGVLQGTTDIAAAIYTYGSNSYWRIGGYRNSGGWTNAANGYFAGQIDEARVYNRTLSTAEIKAQYDAAAPDKTNTSVSQLQGTGRLDSGLAGYWKLDDGSGTSATDSSTNGNTGTLTASPTWSTGQIGGAVTFNDNYINVPDSSVLDAGTKSFSWSFWMKTAQDASSYSWPGIVAKEHNLTLTPRKGWQAYLDSTSPNKVKCAVYYNNLSDIATSNSVLNDNTWHHVTCVRNVDGNGISIYVDGVLNQTSTLTSTGTNDISNSVPLEIGARNEAFNTDNGLVGQVDEVRIYNRILSADEIAQLYRLGTPTGTDTGLKGYWSFNGQDMSGTTAYDRSGAGNNGTLTNGPAITEGKLGQALSFDGTNKFVNAGDPTNGSLDPTNVTISAWVWRNGSQSSYARIVDKMATGGYQLYAYSTGNTLGGYMTNGVTPSGDINSGWTIPNQQWAHVALTYDGTNMLFYGDGVLVKTQAYGSGLANTTDTFSIGNNGSGTGNWNGSIDEVRVYNRVLSASEIKALYASGK